MTSTTRQQRELAAQVLQLIDGKWTTQALGVAAELGLADHLSRGVNELDAIAAASGCDRAALRRLLRALVCLGLVTESGAGRFDLAPAGALLCEDAEPSLHSWALWSARYHWQWWGRLGHSVRTGESARKLVTGHAGYGQLGEDAQAAAIFNRAMGEITRLIAGAVSQAGDFAPARRVADVGGGHGELLAAILAAHPHLQGVLFDLPHAIEGARSRLAEAGLASRCELVAGSFFETVPAGCDAYVLKSVLHNWDDQRCGQLLRACRRAMAPGARVLLVERVMPERITGAAWEWPLVRSDLNMLVGMGGRERTRADLDALLAGAGLATSRWVPIALGFSLIEARSS